MKDKIKNKILKEIESTSYLMNNSWNSDYRTAYFEGKIYAYKYILNEIELDKSLNERED